MSVGNKFLRMSPQEKDNFCEANADNPSWQEEIDGGNKRKHYEDDEG